MLELLKIEYEKIRKYHTFWAILIIYVVLTPLTFLGVSAIPFPFLPEQAELFGFPTVWNYVTYIASWWNLLLGVLIVVMTCNEISFKTQRQNVIDGMSRKNVILSKFYFFTALALAVTLYTFLIGLIVGLIFSNPANMFTDIEYIGVYFIQTLGYFAFAFFFAVLVKRPALSIIFYILIFFFKFVFVISMGTTVSQFMPINVISDLTPFPFFKQLFAMAAIENPGAELPYIISQGVRSIVATVYILIFLASSYLILKRRDI